MEEAAAATAPQALEMGVIDFIAPDLLDLLAQTDGFTVTVLGEERTLHTADAAVEYLDLNPLQDFLNFISNPSIASILLTLGTLGLITELRIPGFGVPGIIGAICLLLGLLCPGPIGRQLCRAGPDRPGHRPADRRAIYANVWRAGRGRAGRLCLWRGPAL